MIGLKSHETVLKFEHRMLGDAIVRAILGHQERFLAVPILRECLAHSLFADSGVVLPCVIEEGRAGIDRLMDNANTGFLVAIANVRAADTEETYFFAGLAKRSARDDSAHGRLPPEGNYSVINCEIVTRFVDRGRWQLDHRLLVCRQYAVALLTIMNDGCNYNSVFQNVI